MFDNIVVIDIDKCVTNGKLNKFARKIVNKLKSYTEISISGMGIHIVAFASGLVFDKGRYYFNNRKLGLEIYPAGFTKRFIMFTGNIVNKYDVVECTDAVQWVLDTYMVKPNADIKVTVNAPGSYLSDETILEKMFTSANGEKTKALWNGGNDGKSASEGDLALCNILVFWCGGDEEQMNPKTLQYLMGHSDISVTMNVYTHFGFDDAEEELKRMEEFRKAQAEVEKKNEKPMTKRMFKAI